jgi:glycosyltransferase involved in cell wall biosynthesis
MNIMINCSNINKGGGVQVSHSFINDLSDNDEHNFLIILSKEINETINQDNFPENFHFINYTLKANFLNVLFGYDSFLSQKEIDYNIDCVFSIFGPSYWKPKSKHLCGFAKPQYIYEESPFFNQISNYQKIILNFKKFLHLRDFKNKCDVLVSENEDISRKLNQILPNIPSKTVTNCYNQVFQKKNHWLNNYKLRSKPNEIIFLTISAYYKHKNFEIIPKVIENILLIEPSINVNFVITLNESELDIKIDDKIKKYITFLGKVDIKECPRLYQQANFLFLPTLLECFSASYPEAMISRTPIITSDLDFAKGICDNAAIYVNPLNPKQIAKKILEIHKDQKLINKLIENGLQRLKHFDDYKTRSKKYLSIIEEMV